MLVTGSREFSEETRVVDNATSHEVPMKDSRKWNHTGEMKVPPQQERERERERTGKQFEKAPIDRRRSHGGMR